MRTTPCRLTVSIEHVGKGGLLAVASAEIEIGRIPLRLHGLEVRRELTGRLRVDVPAYSHGGVARPVLELPDDLMAALGREIAALV
ncbi:MAG: hypothetical protein ACR652_15050 [Methylocystis sp.]|uniref:hypothetical protein n=1 Tax=Methylocystis sp. TaxID=1911079 RepID=UPI003DA44EFF